MSVSISQCKAQEARALTCGMFTMIDDAIGRVRQAGEEANLMENTVQIFTSDHGDHLCDHKLLFTGTEQYDNLTYRAPFCVVIWGANSAHK